MRVEITACEAEKNNSGHYSCAMIVKIIKSACPFGVDQLMR